MIRWKTVVLLSALLCGVAYESCALATGVDILLDEILKIANTGISIYDADYYAMRTGTAPNCICTNGPDEEMAFCPSGLPTPENCNTAKARFAAIAGGNAKAVTDPDNPDIPLTAPIASDFAFGSNVNTYTYVDDQGNVFPRVDNLKGITTHNIYWGKIKDMSGKDVLVKIFEVTFDNSGIGLPASAPRVIRAKKLYAFQVDLLPAGVTTTDYTVRKSDTHANSRKYSGMFTLNGKTVRVATMAQLFP